MNSSQPLPKTAELPCRTLGEALPQLRRPPALASVRFKIQNVSGQAAQAVAYLDARFVFDRLDQVCGGEWSVRFQALPERLVPARNADGDGPRPIYVRCRLTVSGVTREDVGEGEDPKGAFSDAVKRAAVHFGVGRALYAMRLPWMREGEADGELRRNRAGKLILDGRSEAWCRMQYARWLRAFGIRQFGEPLDHQVGAPVSDRTGGARRLDLQQIERARRTAGYHAETVQALAAQLYQQPDLSRLTRPQATDLVGLLQHARGGRLTERALLRCIGRLETKAETERPLAIRAFRQYLATKASEAAPPQGREAA